MSKKNVLRLMIYGVLAGLVVGGAIIIPAPIRHRDYSERRVFKKAAYIMSEVSEAMRYGADKEQASKFLKSSDAESLVRKFNITFVAQRKVRVETRGPIPTEFLPPPHVIVYMHYMDEAHMRLARLTYSRMNVHEMELLRMIRSAGYGTVEILLGGIDSLEEVTDRDRYDEVVLKMYLIVKHLAFEDRRFIEECVELASQTFRNYEKETMVQVWINILLRKALTSPRLPETLSVNEPESYSKGLRDWYLQNKESITFSNSFLFGDNADH